MLHLFSFAFGAVFPGGIILIAFVTHWAEALEGRA